MASKMMEQELDISDSLRASSSDDHVHPVNRGVHPGTAERSDFDSKSVEVPARAKRERVDPGTANDQRRTPLIDVTAITSGSGNSHIVSPPPRKL